MRAYLTELIIKLFRQLDSQRPEFTNSHQLLVEKAIEYMQENFKDHINLDEIVSGIFLSKDYFSKLFKNVTNMPVSAFLQKTRIEEACKMLASTDRKIGDIAEDCGFNDIKFFYTVFKKQIGTTPAQYRNNILKNK